MSYPEGIDVSKWQLEMDWDKAESAGALFAFIRAGSIDNPSGNCYTDFQFERNSELAPEHMPVGFYWYFRPNHNPEKQANYFCDLIEELPWRLPPVLDLETTGGLSEADVTQKAGEFVLKVNERLATLPLMYSRAIWLNDNTVPDDLLKLLDLWIARYTSKGKPWGNILPWPDSPKVNPRDYDDWHFWQYTSTGDGATYGAESNYIDLNRFNGDKEALDKYTGTTPPPYTFPPSIGVKVDIEGVKYKGHIDLVE